MDLEILDERFKMGITSYTKEEQTKILKAYELAYKMHETQLRKSGEPYIIHPLNVALILLSLEADCQTICAGLLHDVLEDTAINLLQLEKMFGEEITVLVDSVSKLARRYFKDKHQQKLASMRKLVSSFETDARVIAIKLADRLHNMRTLEYQSVPKQIAISEETLKIFCPLAQKIGAYDIKHELEDLCFEYLNREKYNELNQKRIALQKENEKRLISIMINLKHLLLQNGIYNDIRYQRKNVYGIYERIGNNESIKDIHDLFSLIVLVPSKDDCYRVKEIIDRTYNHQPKFDKDYIVNPKPNMYQSLHTTALDDDQLIQFQIRTKEMHIISTEGLIGYWSLYGKEARQKMQTDLYKYGFQLLSELNKRIQDDEQYVNILTSQVLGKQIYVYDSNGICYELPLGSTATDFAYLLDENLGDHIWKAIINGVEQEPFVPLKNNDYVSIITKKETNDKKMGKTFLTLSRKQKSMI